MLFEHHPSQDLLTPSINDGGVHLLHPSLTALDFFLLDDIDAYLSPFHSKQDKCDAINHSNNDHSQHQTEFSSSIDFDDLDTLTEESDYLCGGTSSCDGLDIEKWISHSSFPSPPTEMNNMSLANIDDTSFILPWVDEACTINTDMIVPLSPSQSSTSGSPLSSTQKRKLTTVERQLRKKVQNKTAAEKYREKKKSECQKLLDRHSILKNRNKDLKMELENLFFQVQQFNQFFVDVVQTPLPAGN